MTASLSLEACYRTLNLPVGASLADVKTSYRRMARQYHPDVNPCDRFAHEKFIAVTEAYKLLLEIAPEVATVVQPASGDRPQVKVRKTSVRQESSHQTKPRPRKTEFCDRPHLSEEDRQLKHKSYKQLQELLHDCRFPRAIALVEGLTQRLPQDDEVRQWQAIAYQRWGRHLIDAGQLDKADMYLKKAVRLDPKNRALGLEVEKDLRRSDRLKTKR